MMKRALLDMFQAGLAAVNGSSAVEQWLRSEKGSSALNRHDQVLVIGAGKAAADMALGAERVLGDRIVFGLMITKDGHGASLQHVRLREAGHPVPDERGLSATAEMLELVRRADAKTLVLCLLSGGGSALMTAPAAGLTIGDKRTVTDLLMRAGANIDELNAVRKHLSSVKGGGLSRAACSAPMITLAISDVLGDKLDVIASGPTVPDNMTFQDALTIIGKYGLREKIPERVRTHLAKGVSGLIPETMKQGDRCLANKRAVVVAALAAALDAARAKAAALGYPAKILLRNLNGEAQDAARMLAQQAAEARKELAPGERLCLISGGETTVTVRGDGRGGRNQELALAFALAIAGRKGILLLSAGTDGTDGPTDAAGAVVDGNTVLSASMRGLDAQAYLARNDSYTFFQRYDALWGAQTHVKTGPTGTNVMDMQIILVERDVE